MNIVTFEALLETMLTVELRHAIDEAGFHHYFIVAAGHSHASAPTPYREMPPASRHTLSFSDYIDEQAVTFHRQPRHFRYRLSRLRRQKKTLSMLLATVYIV